MREAAGRSLRLGKDISHLFRDRAGQPQVHLDVRDLTEVIEVDAAAGTVDTMAMATYDSLARACFAEGMVPAVVPQLKSITIGGAISGLGIESSSFKYGLSHETIEEMEVLLPEEGRSSSAVPTTSTATSSSDWRIPSAPLVMFSGSRPRRFRPGAS